MPEMSLPKNRLTLYFLCELTITKSTIKFKLANNANTSGYFNKKGKEQNYFKMRYSYT